MKKIVVDLTNGEVQDIDLTEQDLSDVQTCKSVALKNFLLMSRVPWMRN